MIRTTYNNNQSRYRPFESKDTYTDRDIPACERGILNVIDAYLRGVKILTGREIMGLPPFDILLTNQTVTNGVTHVSRALVLTNRFEENEGTLCALCLGWNMPTRSTNMVTGLNMANFLIYRYLHQGIKTSPLGLTYSKSTIIMPPNITGYASLDHLVSIRLYQIAWVVSAQSTIQANAASLRTEIFNPQFLLRYTPWTLSPDALTDRSTLLQGTDC